MHRLPKNENLGKLVSSCMSNNLLKFNYDDRFYFTTFPQYRTLHFDKDENNYYENRTLLTL